MEESEKDDTLGIFGDGDINDYGDILIMRMYRPQNHGFFKHKNIQHKYKWAQEISNLKYVTDSVIVIKRNK